MRAILKRLTPLDYMAAILAIALVLSFTVPGMSAAAAARHEAKALSFVRHIQKWQTDFRATHRRYAATFAELSTAGLYEGPAAAGSTLERDGYAFRLGTLEDANLRYFVIAIPVKFGRTGAKSYYVDDTGVVRQSSGPVAGPAFPEVP